MFSNSFQEHRQVLSESDTGSTLCQKVSKKQKQNQKPKNQKNKAVRNSHQMPFKKILHIVLGISLQNFQHFTSTEKLNLLKCKT